MAFSFHERFCNTINPKTEWWKQTGALTGDEYAQPYKKGQI